MLAVGAHAADFQSRCGAPGVLVCRGFDAASDFAPGVLPGSGVYGPDPCTNCRTPSQDSQVSLSGASSVRFDINGQTSSDMAGSFRQFFGRTFGNGTTFYVQFALRYDPNLVALNWYQLVGTGWESAVFHGAANSSCSDAELTTAISYDLKLQQLTTECGARGLWTSQTPPLLLQQGDHPCDFDATQAGDTSACFTYADRADVWITYYYKVTIGVFGTPSSSIEAWYSTRGEPFSKFIDLSNFNLKNATGPTNDFAYVTVSPYMRGKNQAVNHPTAHLWLDELIVSTQPIAAPGPINDAGNSDPNGYRIFSVGCGCGAAGASPILLFLVAGLAIRKRAGSVRGRTFAHADQAWRQLDALLIEAQEHLELTGCIATLKALQRTASTARRRATHWKRWRSSNSIAALPRKPARRR